MKDVIVNSEDIINALLSIGDEERADNLAAILLGVSLDAVWEFEEERMNQIADELQAHILTLDNNAVEDFCGFKLDGQSKEDAVYEVMTQMPDDVIVEFYHKYCN